MDDTRYIRPGLHHEVSVSYPTYRLSFRLGVFFVWVFSVFSPHSCSVLHSSPRFRMNQCQSLTVWKRLVRRMYSYHVSGSTYCFVLNSIELSSKVETGHAINSEYLEELA